MSAPVVISGTLQRTPAWLDAKKNGIGSSQAAAAIGLSHWQSRIGLWAEFLGLVPPAAETMPMRLGAELEPFIARCYTEATGIKVRRANNLRQHPVHGFMLASIDRRAGRKPIELKWSARGDGYGEPGTDEVPDDVLVQVLHQLAVLDEPEGEVALLRPSRAQVDVFVIRREPAAEAAMIEEEAVFWDAVQTRTEPPVDGSEATRRTLNALYQRQAEDVILEADEIVASDLRALRAIRGELKGWAKTEAETEARIKAAMLADHATVIRAAGVGQVTWRQPKASETTDWKRVAGIYRDTLEAIAAGLPNADPWPLEVDAVVRAPQAIESLNTTTKPSTPRFVPKWETEEE